MLTIREVDPTREEIAALIRDLDAYQESLYPPESNHLVPIQELATQKYFFLAAFTGERVAGIGSFQRTESDYVEIKRVYVPDTARGNGVALSIMAALEEKAAQEGFAFSRLETGILQKAAIALYEKLGYGFIDPFGDYKIDPLSVFMEKRLT